MVGSSLAALEEVVELELDRKIVGLVVVVRRVNVCC
jgi:hypothetical protein